MNEPSERLPFLFLMLTLLVLAAWAMLRPPVNVVIFSLPNRAPIIQTQ